jgi:hypothetical protein
MEHLTQLNAMTSAMNSRMHLLEEEVPATVVVVEEDDNKSVIIHPDSSEENELEPVVSELPVKEEATCEASEIVNALASLVEEQCVVGADATEKEKEKETKSEFLLPPTPTPENFKPFRSIAYDDHDQTYARNLTANFIRNHSEATRLSFNAFTEGLMDEPRINRNSLLDAISAYEKTLTSQCCPLSTRFTDEAFNCRPYQPCVIC